MEEKTYPYGKIDPSDDGELHLVITEENGRVLLHFGKQVTWLGLTPEQARAMAKGLEHYAKRAEEVTGEAH